jgi:hypothetical protein
LDTVLEQSDCHRSADWLPLHQREVQSNKHEKRSGNKLSSSYKAVVEAYEESKDFSTEALVKRKNF